MIRVLDSRPRGCGFKPHRRHCVVSLSKNINPSLVLVQPRKTCPFITERLLMWCKESNQTNNLLSLLKQKHSPVKEIQFYLEIVSCDPSIRTLCYPQVFFYSGNPRLGTRYPASGKVMHSLLQQGSSMYTHRRLGSPCAVWSESSLGSQGSNVSSSGKLWLIRLCGCIH